MATDRDAPIATPLRRLLPRWGVMSRGECDRAVAEGRLARNGERVRDAAVAVDPARDVITLDGAELAPLPRLYLMMHKPAGVTTTMRDPDGRRTVRDLIPKDRVEWRRAKPVGRLDRDSSGLLLLTTDGDLHFAITGPESRVEKIYRVEVNGHPDDAALAPLERGIELRGEMLAPMPTRVLSRTERTTILEMTLTQGRFRQIRRVLRSLGIRVKDLHRVRVGPVELGSLACGAVAPIDPSALSALLARIRGDRTGVA